MAFCDFGKTVKKKLVDLDRTQVWLSGEITKRTGLYMDSSYMSKVFRGVERSPKVISAICDILDIRNPDIPMDELFAEKEERA